MKYSRLVIQEPLHLFSSYLDLSILDWMGSIHVRRGVGQNMAGGGKLVRSTQFHMPLMGSLGDEHWVIVHWPMAVNNLSSPHQAKWPHLQSRARAPLGRAPGSSWISGSGSSWDLRLRRGTSSGPEGGSTVGCKAGSGSGQAHIRPRVVLKLSLMDGRWKGSFELMTSSCGIVSPSVFGLSFISGKKAPRARTS